MVWFFWLEIANLSGLKDFAFAAFYIYNYNERVETPTAPNSNSSSAEAIFDQKIPSHSFQTEQHVRGRFEESSRIVRSKIHPNGPELAFEQKRVTKNFKPSECVATKSCAEGNLLFPSLFPIGQGFVPLVRRHSSTFRLKCALLVTNLKFGTQRETIKESNFSYRTTLTEMTFPWKLNLY